MNDRNGDGIYDVAAIVGSLRRDSFNRGLLRAAMELKPEAMRIFEVPIRDLPLFDEDVEQQGDPGPVRALKASFQAADAILICTPEYNQSVPGVLSPAPLSRSGTAAVHSMRKRCLRPRRTPSASA